MHSTESAKQDKLKVGLIGVTGFGAVHYDMCMKAHAKGQISLTVCVIINPEVAPDIVQELESIDCEVVDSTDEMFERYVGRLDLVMIPTGIPTHAPFTIKSLEMGASVFVEKPAAGTLADVDAMIAAEGANRGFVAVGFQDIFRRDIQELKKQLVEATYGRIERLSVVGCWPRGKSYYERNNWAGMLKANGRTINDSPANNAMAHFVNLALFLAGEDYEGSASIRHTQAELKRANPIESFDTVTSSTQLEEGPILNLALTHACDDEQTLITIITNRCRIVLDYINQEIRIVSLSGELIKTLPSDYQVSREMIMDDLLCRISSEEQFVCSLKIARSHTQLIESLHTCGTISDFCEDEIQTKAWRGSELRYVPGLSRKLSDATLN